MTDLQDAYNDIHREFHIMAKAFLVLKRKNKSLEMTVNSLSDELAEAKRLPEADIQGNPQVEPNVPSSECCANCSKISSERDRLSNALQKFTKGSEMLDIILMNQRAYRDKTGLGYKHKEKKWAEPKVKPYLKFFHKATGYMSSPFSFCNYCNRKGHTTSSCNAKKHGTDSYYK